MFTCFSGINVIYSGKQLFSYSTFLGPLGKVTTNDIVTIDCSNVQGAKAITTKHDRSRDK
jgi:hypothetical protein